METWQNIGSVIDLLHVLDPVIWKRSTWILDAEEGFFMSESRPLLLPGTSFT